MTMHWDQLLLAHRLNEPLNESVQAGRTHFHKDYDRIVFSSPFRRLERKTQVHPLAENDHVHSRLTHSLEVSCVGRSLGAMTGAMMQDDLPEWISPADLGAIVQAACLGHDIGNPPFGHTGEDAIRQWFLDPKNAPMLDGLSELECQDLQTFEGNAQGFRILTQLEHHRFDGGMRLTYATLGAFLKYPWLVDNADRVPDKGKKFGIYQSEKHIAKELATSLGLIEVEPLVWSRHPLVYLMEAADDICYALIDLEDGVEMNLLRYEEMESLVLPLLDDKIPSSYHALTSEDPARRRMGALRGKAIDRMVQEVSQVFVENRTSLLLGEFQGDLIDHCSHQVRDCISGAKKLARDKIFKHGSKNIIEIGAYTTLGNILEVFISAAQELVTKKTATFRNARIIELMGTSAPQSDWTLYQAYMRVIDYIAGMTDNFAVDIAQNIRGLKR